MLIKVLSICNLSVKGNYFKEDIQLFTNHLINLMILCKYHYKIPDLLFKMESVVKDNKFKKHHKYLEKTLELLTPRILEIVSMPYPKIYFKLCLCIDIYQISIGTIIIVFIYQRISTVSLFLDKIMIILSISVCLFCIQIFSHMALSKIKRKNLYYKILNNRYKSFKKNAKNAQNKMNTSRIQFKKVKKFKEDDLKN